MRILYLLTLCLLIPTLSHGQGLIADRIQKASEKNSGESFELMQPANMTLAAAAIPEDELTNGLLVSLDGDAISDLQKARPELLRLQVNLPDLGNTELSLIPNQVLAPGFVLTTSDGRVVDYEGGLYYHGIITGDDKSLAAVSVFDNEIHAVISTEEGNYIIGKLDDSDLHIVYNDRHYLQPKELDCATPDDGVMYEPEMLEYVGPKDVGDCINVYVEIDNDIYNDKGGTTGATNYVTGVFNESITLYANENLAMAISEIKVWTSSSPYSSTSSSGMLSDFQAATGSFNGDLAHLVSYQASGGIAAGFSGICNSNPDNSKCFSSISGSYSAVPTYSFTVMVVTHEMGHLIGSRHTHACVWNGNGTAIDGCAGGTEGSCSVPGSPSGGGTIMSYCHLTTGIDFTQGFGPQPGNVIRNTVANANCLGQCGTPGPNCFDGVQNGDETGVDCGGSCDPCPVPCTDNEVTVSINLDNYPEETSWTITNAGGSVVASGGTYGSFPDGSNVTEVVCLPDGCYDFTINDSYGDGICCSYGIGDYSVTDSGGSTLASGGSFGSSETTNFCVGGSSGPTCSDGIQNGDETGVDCGGSVCPACPPTCDDGIQNGDETGVDCGGSSCPACPPTCDDGIQNGDETGVDCGGSCDPCPGGGPETVFAHYFESGWDGWIDGGSDCYRYSGTRSWEGSYSIRIRDNSGPASTMTSAAYNVSGYSTLEFKFYFYPNSMETGEDFWVEYFDGSSWIRIATYASGSSFNNNTFYSSTLNLSTAQVNFPTNARFRITCDASANADRVYIDQVTLVGNASGFVEDGPIVVQTEELEGAPIEFDSSTPDLSDQESIDVEEGEILLFPNPAREQLQVRASEVMQSIRLISATGQELQLLQLDADQSSIDLSKLQPGLYYLIIEMDGDVSYQRFLKQ